MAEDQPPGVAAPPDVVQLNVVLVPTVTLITDIFPSGPESAAALVQAPVNLRQGFFCENARVKVSYLGFKVVRKEVII